LNSCDGVIYALKVVYFDNSEDHELYDECIATLENHKGAEFPVI